MRNFSDEGAAALSSYLERGRLALKALETGKLDRAERFMRRMAAAFHNFRAIDALALEAGCDLAQDVRIKETWAEIQLTNVQVAKMLESQMELQRDELHKVQFLRRHLDKYRANKTPVSGFRQSV